MSLEQWTSVDHYFTNTLNHSDSVLEAALAASQAAGLPAINVSPTQGKFLHILAQSINAQRILEIGTLGGYSTIWLALALPPTGRLISLEYEPKHAEVARANLTRAGLSTIAEVRQGKALDLLPRLAEEKQPPFDLVFIDADKPSNPDYFSWALKLTHPGSLIIVDNVVRNGAVADLASTDPSIQGVHRCLKMIAAEPRVTATALQTVGTKGYDGFALALVISA